MLTFRPALILEHNIISVFHSSEYFTALPFWEGKAGRQAGRQAGEDYREEIIYYYGRLMNEIIYGRWMRERWIANLRFRQHETAASTFFSKQT